MPPPPNQRPRKTGLVSPRLVLGVVGMSVVLATALIPSRRQLMRRLLEDGQTARAQEIAGLDPVAAAPPAAGPVRKELTPLELLREALAGGGRIDPILAIRGVHDPRASMGLLRSAGSDLEPHRRAAMYRECATEAVAAADPEFAADILTEAIEFAPGEELLTEAVQACRWSGQAGRALNLIETWKNAGRPLSEALEAAEMTLFREVNKPGAAFDILQARMLRKQQGGGQCDNSEIDLGIEVSGQAARAGEMLPFLERHLAALPAGSASFDDLAAGKVTADADFSRYLGFVARHCEWTGQPDKAVDCYMKMAVTGDRNALKRIEALMPGLNRRGDWLRVLEKCVPVPERPELMLEMARLQGTCGEYDKAAAAYATWLKDHPKDAAAWGELAAVHDECGRLEEALQSWRKVMALEPGNLAAGKEAADLRIAMKDFRGAFEFYHLLPEKSHDAATLETYALLAESLADYDAVNRALLMRYHRLRIPKADDILELARSYRTIGKVAGEIAALEDGRRRLPRSRVLRIELAQSYRNAGRFDEAVSLLATDELRKDMRAMCLFVEVACLKEDYQFALSFLGRGIEKQFPFPPDVRLDLGHIYFNNGYMTEANALYSSVPDEPSLWPLLAGARFKVGDFKAAETYQRKYLERTRVPDSAGWLMLGDILKAQGRESDARGAYARSLSLMAGKIAETPADAGASRVDDDDESPRSVRERRPTRPTSR